MSELTARQEEYLDALPQPSYQAWADAVDAAESSAGSKPAPTPSTSRSTDEHGRN